MPCYHPNIRLCDHYPEQFGEKSKTLAIINSYGDKFISYEYYEKRNRQFEAVGETYEFQKIPCKLCCGCQEKYSKDWATRCMLEAQKWTQNFFITLTYDEEHIPRDDELVNKKTGEIFQNDNWEQGHLETKHSEKFIKDLRRYWEYHFNHKGIRFYLAGEYGSKTKRPHMHAILFNLPIKPEQLEVYKITQNGDMLWKCPEIEKIWGKGFISLAEVNWDTCAYVARYVMKKQKGKKSDEWYYEQGMSPEFVRMSNRPGIGLDFFKENFQKIYEHDEIIINGHKQSIQSVKPCEYYDRKYAEMFPEEMEKIKQNRKIVAKATNELKNRQSSLTEKERLAVEERSKNAKWNTLKRDKI